MGMQGAAVQTQTKTTRLCDFQGGFGSRIKPQGGFMQIIINTAEMLGDETTIRDEVIEQVSDALIKAFKEKVADAVSTILDDEVRKVAATVLAEITNAHLDAVITPTNKYGEQEPPYTLRNKIAQITAAQCVYKKARYDSDKNAFSQAVDDTIVGEVRKFKDEFNSVVTKQILEQTMEQGVQRLREAFKIK